MMLLYTPLTDENFTGGFILDHLTFREDILQIRVENSKMVVTVTIDTPYTYRYIDEGDAIKMVADFAANGVFGRLIYSVKNSDFLDWFADQTYDAKYERDKIEHCAIVGSNFILDVIVSNIDDIDNSIRWK